MALVVGIDKVMCLDIRGQYGYSCGFGRVRYGGGRFGFFDLQAGIYSRKRTLKGWGISRMAYYRPSNPRTMKQQAWREFFAGGIAQYHLLTPTEKASLLREGRMYRQSGLTLFMARYISSHR